MFKPAPSVYVPVEPEGDGIALPSLLSLVVHCSIIAFVIYSHQIPKIEAPLSIETSIVTPEELAALQGEIIANREAVAAAGTPLTTNPDNDIVTDPTPIIIEPNNQQVNTEVSRPVSVFMRSDDEPDDFSASNAVLDPRIKDNIAKKQEAFDLARKAFDKTQKEDALQEHKAFEQSMEKAYLEEQKALDKLHITEANPASVVKPKRSVDITYPSKTNAKTPPSSNLVNQKSVSLGSSAGAPQANAASLQSSSASQVDDNQLRSQVSSKVYRNWRPPKNRVGKTIKADIKVDASGYVRSITIHSTDAALEQSLREAINKSSPFSMLTGTDVTSLTPTFTVK